MAGTFAIDAYAQSAATPGTVWAVLTDAPGWTVWAGCHEAVVESGRDLTEVRRFKVALLPGLPRVRITSREKTTVYDPPGHWAYEMLSGPPGVADLAAHVTLSKMEDEGTAIRWRVTFTSNVPGLGPLLRSVLGRLYRDCAVGLAHAAETAAQR